MPVKILTRIALVFCFYVSSTFAFITYSDAEEFYTYKDNAGNLVISNKPPPPGSTVLKRQDLPELPKEDVPLPEQGDLLQPSPRAERSPKRTQRE